MDEPPPAGIRTALSTRGLLVIAAVVVVVALLIVLLGARSGTGAADGGGSGGSGIGGTGAGTGQGGSAGLGSGRGGAEDPDSATVTDAPGAPGASDGSGASGVSGASGRPVPTPSAAPVLVHVLGAVAQPGLLTLQPGDRVQAAIEAAGGTTDGADLARVNLARVLVDGEQLYVPLVGETPPVPLGPSSGTAAAGTGAGPSSGDDTRPDDIVDLNTADSATLETLPGIGPALAGRILAWRESNGGFGAVEDLLEVNGIGDVRFAELEPLVRV